MKKYHAIGLMSGTSLDGLDICYVEFLRNKKWSFKIIHAKNVPYTEEWKNKLKNSISFKSEDLLALNVEYGFYLAEEVKKFRLENKITKIDIISSHGHTIFHQPNRNFTLQIGDGRAIKALNNYPIAYDFRTQDLILGGNGAPLVPIGDFFLFNDYSSCINLGGFSNISFNKDNRRIAFDICPVNVVLNNYSKKLGLNYDNKGKIAQNGHINISVLKQLNELPFYTKYPPKSLGIEWVIKNILPLLDQISPADAISTFTEHAVFQISEILKKYSISNCLISGGGAYNTFLINQLTNRTSTKITLPTPSIIEYKEALIFAFIGVLRLRNENNILSSASGSLRDHSSGILIP